jgi:hypothetical protein
MTSKNKVVVSQDGHVKYFYDLVQGTDEWFAARCGLLTASEMKLIITVPKVETRVKKDGTPYKQREIESADTDACRAHLYELLAQRISKYVEPTYISDDMLRGKEDEIEAASKYNEHFAPVQLCGFVTNDQFGFTIGYSPDGLVGDDGLIESKSRRQKYQIETIIEYSSQGKIPEEYMLQVQTGLLVTRRKWCDFISYSGGYPMIPVRVYPDPVIQKAIIEASGIFEDRLIEKWNVYREFIASGVKQIPTERRIAEEIVI